MPSVSNSPMACANIWKPVPTTASMGKNSLAPGVRGAVTRWPPTDEPVSSRSVPPTQKPSAFTRSLSAVTAAATAAKKQAASGTATIIPQITGAALNHYRRDVSLIFSVSRGMQTGPDKRPVDGFWFNARHKEFDAKSRLLLPDVLPADWRVVRQHLGGL